MEMKLGETKTGGEEVKEKVQWLRALAKRPESCSQHPHWAAHHDQFQGGLTLSSSL